MAHADHVRVTLARSRRADEVERVDLSLPAGSKLADALQAAAWPTEGWSVGVWGRVQPLDRPLRDGDRVELCRPLTVDPKEARRPRYKRQRKR